MPRADLHYALCIDRDIHEASEVDPSLLDPLVRVEGAVPGLARPIRVLREYQGPQGEYVERFVLRNRTGEERYASPSRRVRLRGEAFEDRFVSDVTDVKLLDAEEHTLTFYIGDEDVGEIPVFIESGLGGDPYVAVENTVTKALQKGSVLWLAVPQPPRRKRFRTVPGGVHEQAAWFVLDGGTVYVLSGPTEQQILGLDRADEVELVVRSKEVRSRIARVPAEVSTIPVEDPQFEKVARAALGKRLNLPDGDGALKRWKANCTLYALTPRWRPEGAVDPAAVEDTEAAEAEAGAAPNLPNEAEPGTAVEKEEEIHVEAQIDQEIFDALIAEGKSERVARAKAKAAYVRREKARIREERASDS